MRRSQLIQFLKRRSLLLSLVTVAPLIVVILGLTACVEYPVGDSEKSKVDPKYSGVWVTKEDGGEDNLLFLRPYDSRTYYVNIFTYSREGDEIKPSERLDFKAWLTSIGDATFISMECLSCEHFAGVGEKPPYLVGKMDLKDGSLHLRFVNGDEEPAENANNSSELEKVIAENVDLDALYIDDEFVFEKAKDKSFVESVLEAFEPPERDW